MKLLIAGLGSIGSRHLRNLLALGESDILLYRTNKSTLANDELAPFPTFTDLEQALAQNPDAVIVSNPTAKHIGVALPAAEAGCHLFIEKPISHNLQDLDRLKQALEKHNRQLLVGFHFRYHPVLEQIKQIIESGEIGRPLSAHVHWGEYLPAWHPWEDYRSAYAARAELGGGVVLTLCHPFDYLRWLIGAVGNLSARVAKVSDLEINVEDHADVSLQFENGCMGFVHLDYYQWPAAHWLQITTSNGFIYWDNESGSAKVYNAADKVWRVFNVPSGFERNNLFLSEMAHFLAVVKDGAPPGCGYEDGLQALRIALAVHTSSANGSAIIEP